MENNSTNNKKSSNHNHHKNDRRSRRRNISSTSSIENNSEHKISCNQTRKDLKNFIKIFKQKSKNIQRLLEEYENLDNQVCNRENGYDDDFDQNANLDNNKNKVASRSKIQTRSSLKSLPAKKESNSPVTPFSKNFCF